MDTLNGKELSTIRNVPTFWSLSEVNIMERNAVVLHALGLPVCSDRAESMKVEALVRPFSPTCQTGIALDEIGHV